MEMKHKFTSGGYPKNYVAIARRGDALRAHSPAR
jgi:hypothetical protein